MARAVVLRGLWGPRFDCSLSAGVVRADGRPGMNHRGEKLPFVRSSRSDLLFSHILEHGMSLFNLFRRLEPFRLQADQMARHWSV